MQNSERYISKCFADAAKDVIYTTTGLSITEVDYIESENENGYISGIMLILGKSGAVIFLTMEYETAALLASCMTGCELEELSREEIFDGAAELVNMIAGKTRVMLVGDEYYFEVTPPFTINGYEHFEVDRTRQANIFKRFCIEDKYIYLKVLYM